MLLETPPQAPTTDGQTDLGTSRTTLRPTVIQPTRGWQAIRLNDLWDYRELLYFLVWRDIKVRYKQTLLGAAWALLQPLGTMLVFTLVFGRLVRVPSGGLPYSVFAYSGLVVWMYFANGLTQASQSLVDHERIITKIYFPRLLLPVAAVLGAIMDLGVSTTLLIGMLLVYHLPFHATLIFGAFFVFLAAATALGIGVWLAALNVRYRDVRYVIPFLVQFLLFGTPVAYPSSLVAPQWQTVYALNPMVGAVEGMRWAITGHGFLGSWQLVASSASCAALVCSSLFYFRRMEKSFADVI